MLRFKFNIVDIVWIHFKAVTRKAERRNHGTTLKVDTYNYHFVSRVFSRLSIVSLEGCSSHNLG